MKTIEYNRLHVGVIELGDEAMVSDPCYDKGLWCQGIIKNLLPGKYHCYIDEFYTGSWGHRIGFLHVIHDDYLKVSLDDFVGKNLENVSIGVDSGQCGIYDVSYFNETRNDEEWYKRACDLTYIEDRSSDDIHPFTGGIIDGKGVVSSSGYGDGGYHCLTRKNDEGKVIAITVDFFVKDELEEDDEYYDDYEMDE